MATGNQGWTAAARSSGQFGRGWNETSARIFGLWPPAGTVTFGGLPAPSLRVKRNACILLTAGFLLQFCMTLTFRSDWHRGTGDAKICSQFGIFGVRETDNFAVSLYPQL
jgi:hypothetical protein